MKIKIMGHAALERTLKVEPKVYDVIHYTNSRWQPLEPVKLYAKEWMHIPADDIDHYNYKDHKAPTRENIQSALDWSKGRENLIVACHAGVSRSSATALAIAAREWGVETALAMLDKYEHCPNRLIVYIASRLLDMPKLWKDYIRWQIEHVMLDPSNDGQWPYEELIERMK